MKKIYDDGDEEFNRKLTREEKIQICVRVVPIVLIVIILLITLLVKSVSNRRNQEGSSQADASVSTDVIAQETEEALNLVSTPIPSVVQGKEESTPVPTAEPTPTPYKEVMESGKVDYSKVPFHTEEQLKEMSVYWEAGNQKALDDLANLDRFIAMSYQLRGTQKFFYYGDKNSNGLPEGRGIAVYADNQYYYGDWKNGVREGNGFFRHYHIHPTGKSNDIITFHQYSGEFKNDLPDGAGSEHYDFRTELLKQGECYYSNYIGNYKKALLDGDFYITSIDWDNNMKEWNAAAKNGSFLYQADSKDKEGKRPVMVEISNPENYIWMSAKENQNLGVMCYISEKK